MNTGADLYHSDPLHRNVKSNFQESNSEIKSSSTSLSSSDESDSISIPPLKECDNTSASSSIGSSTIDHGLSVGNASPNSNTPSVIFEPDDNSSDLSCSSSETSIPGLIFRDDSTASSHTSDLSAEFDSISSLEAYPLDAEEITYNYRGPKVLPKNETPVTICIAGTIGLIRSRKLFRVLLDSGSNKCLIKRSAIPMGVVPKNWTTERISGLSPVIYPHKR